MKVFIVFSLILIDFQASSLQVASAGDAKRKQSARPSVRMSEGVLDLAHLVILPKSLLAGVRVTRRGNHADDRFFIIFSASKISSQNPAQGFPKGPPRDPKITKNLSFSFQNRPKDHPFIRFSVDLCFYHFLDEFLVNFFGKNDTKNDASFHSGAFFFGTADPYDSMVFTIRKLLFQFLPF